MKRSLSAKDLYGVVTFGVILVILAQFVTLVMSLLVSIILALIFSTALDIPVRWLKKHKISRPIGTLVCMITVISIVVLFISLITPPMIDEVKMMVAKAPGIMQKLDTKAEVIAKKLGVNYDFIKSPTFFNKKLEEVMPSVIGGATVVGLSTVTNLVSIFLTIVFTSYILSEPRPLIKGVMDPFDLNTKKKIRRCMFRMQKAVISWILGILIGSFFIFLLTWIGLLLIGMDSAFLFAAIAGILNIIPTLGPILSALPPILVSLIINPIQALWILLVYTIVQQLESHLITPLVMQKQLSIHPVVLLISIFIMGTLLGLVGIFITAPLVASIGIIYDEFYKKPKLRRTFE